MSHIRRIVCLSQNVGAPSAARGDLRVQPSDTVISLVRLAMSREWDPMIASPGDTIVSAAAELLCSGAWVAQR